MNAQDARYAHVFLTPLRECAKYKPQLGGASQDGVSVTDFIRLYGADPLYSWVGLNSAVVYAAHKAAGGITSIYRQLGIGCERLVRQIMSDSLGLEASQLKWSYEVVKDDGSKAVLTLDAKIELADLADPEKRDRVSTWLLASGEALGLRKEKARELRGAVFEVRQGYKSADSKRQNADLQSALRAYADDLLPVIMVVSSQINQTVLRRYRAGNIQILAGTLSGSSTDNTFAFFSEVVGYDLQGFFERNQDALRGEVEAIVRTLLTA